MCVYCEYEQFNNNDHIVFTNNNNVYYWLMIYHSNTIGMLTKKMVYANINSVYVNFSWLHNGSVERLNLSL